jgi:hypothetical protein
MNCADQRRWLAGFREHGAVGAWNVADVSVEPELEQLEVISHPWNEVIELFLGALVVLVR